MLDLCSKCEYFKAHKYRLPTNRIVGGWWVGDGKCMYLIPELIKKLGIPVVHYTVREDSCVNFELKEEINETV